MSYSATTTNNDIELAALKQGLVSNPERKRQTTRNKRVVYAVILLVAALCFVAGLVMGRELLAKGGSGSVGVSGEKNNDADDNGDVDDSNSEHGHFGFGHNADGRSSACKSLRCCALRSGVELDQLVTETGQSNCGSFDDYECGFYDAFCVWDCTASRAENTKLERHFRGISQQTGIYTVPAGADVELDSESESESELEAQDLEAFISLTSVTAMDSCGVVYDEVMPKEVAKIAFEARTQPAASTTDHDASTDTPLSAEELGAGVAAGKNVVLGPDGRTQVTSTAFPWRTVGFLTFKDSSGNTYRCTATMISRRYAITAAHCLYGGGDFYSDFYFYDNVIDCDDLVTPFSINNAVVFTAFINGDANYDMGWVQFSSTNSGLGYLDFGYAAFSSPPPIDFNIISYPGDKPSCSKWYQYCPYATFYTYTQRTYECDTSGGASGSAVFLYWSSSGDMIIYAIHTLGVTGSYNSAVRITSPKYSAICNYIESDAYEDPDHCG